MALTLYTAADPELIKAALTGVAMVFDPSNTEAWVSSDGLGLGAVAGIGLLISLGIILFKAIMTQKLELGGLFIMIVVYIIAFVPKTTLQVERTMDGAIEMADGIPYGVAVPAALMSGMMKAVTDTFEVAFSDPGVGTYSETGFMDPLKTLAKMRGVTYRSGNVVLRQNLHNFLSACTVDSNTGARTNFEEAFKRAGSHQALFNPDLIKDGTAHAVLRETSGSTIDVYLPCKTPQDGMPTALEQMQSDFNSYMGFSGTSINGLEADLIREEALNQLQPGVSATDKVKSSLTLLTGGATIDQNIAMADLVAGALMREVGYAAMSEDKDATSATMLLTESREKFAVDSAGGASMFLTTMQKSMDIMLFVWIALAPIVAMSMMIAGMAGLKMLAQYFLFGVWTQSWMPFAMVINYYMQLSLVKSMEQRMFGDPANIFSITAQTRLYEDITTTLATGSQLLAATPVLSLAVLSGSYFALTNLGTAMGGKDGYVDEKKMAPDVQKATGADKLADASMQHAGAFGPGFAGTVLANGGGAAFTGALADSLPGFNSGTVASATTQSGKSLDSAQMFAAKSAINDALKDGTSIGKAVSSAVQAIAGSDVRKQDENLKQFLTQNGVTDTDKIAATDLAKTASRILLQAGISGQLDANQSAMDDVAGKQLKNEQRQKELNDLITSGSGKDALMNPKTPPAQMKSWQDELKQLGDEAKGLDGQQKGLQAKRGKLLGAKAALSGEVAGMAESGSSREQAMATALSEAQSFGEKTAWSNTKSHTRNLTATLGDEGKSGKEFSTMAQVGQEYSDTQQRRESAATGQGSSSQAGVGLNVDGKTLLGMMSGKSTGLLNDAVMNGAQFDKYGSDKGAQMREVFKHAYNDGMARSGNNQQYALASAVVAMSTSDDQQTKATGLRMAGALMSAADIQGAGQLTKGAETLDKDAEAQQRLQKIVSGGLEKGEGVEATAASTLATGKKEVTDGFAALTDKTSSATSAATHQKAKETNAAEAAEAKTATHKDMEDDHAARKQSNHDAALKNFDTKAMKVLNTALNADSAAFNAGEAAVGGVMTAVNTPELNGLNQKSANLSRIEELGQEIKAAQASLGGQSMLNLPLEKQDALRGKMDELSDLLTKEFEVNQFSDTAYKGHFAPVAKDQMRDDARMDAMMNFMDETNGTRSQVAQHTATQQASAQARVDAARDTMNRGVEGLKENAANVLDPDKGNSDRMTLGQDEGRTLGSPMSNK